MAAAGRDRRLLFDGLTLCCRWLRVQVITALFEECGSRKKLIKKIGTTVVPVCHQRVPVLTGTVLTGTALTVPGTAGITPQPPWK